MPGYAHVASSMCQTMNQFHCPVVASYEVGNMTFAAYHVLLPFVACAAGQSSQSEASWDWPFAGPVVVGSAVMAAPCPDHPSTTENASGVPSLFHRPSPSSKSSAKKGGGPTTRTVSR